MKICPICLKKIWFWQDYILLDVPWLQQDVHFDCWVKDKWYWKRSQIKRSYYQENPDGVR